MVEDTGIVNAIDSFVASLEEEQNNGKLIEDNSNAKKPEMSEDNRLMGLDNIARIIKKSVEMICLGEKVKVNTKLDDFEVSVHGEDLGMAIGRDGKNMDALEYLVNLIGKRKNIVDKKVTIDIKDYKKNKIEKVTNIALKMAKKAIKEGRKIALSPMCSHERKIIHNALSKFKDITTRSKDEEPNRRIIIYPLKEAK
jgi:spoIIIJ-associated protein